MWIAVLLVFGYFLAGVCVITATAKAPLRRGALSAVPSPLRPQTAQKGNIGVYLDAIGTVTPIIPTRLPVKSQIGEASPLHGSQLVRKGQALIDIDARPFEAHSCRPRDA